MKCTICGGKAALKIAHHHLALCKSHYLEWIPEQTERFIKKYRMFTHSDRILVAVSGGKDSLSLWDVLWRLGYQVDGIYINLGIDGGFAYSAQSRSYSEKFAAERGLNLQIISVQESYGQSIPQLAESTYRGKQKPCSVCGVSKRHIMNQAAQAGGYTVLATGHNLDDEVAVLFGNTLEWKLDPLARQGPVLEEAQGLARKVKPFFRFYERETAAYALMRGIPYIYDECPFAEGSKSLYYKQLLNQLEADRPGAKLVFYLDFLKAKQAGAFPQQVFPENGKLQPCPTCGQPTSAPGECSFCRMVARVRE